MTCFQDDFEASIAHLRMPVKHRKAIRTTNLLEHRRLKVIPNACGEKAVLKLMFAAMTRAFGTWRPIGVTGLERRQMEQVRSELGVSVGEWRGGPDHVAAAPSCAHRRSGRGPVPVPCATQMLHHGGGP